MTLRNKILISVGIAVLLVLILLLLLKPEKTFNRVEISRENYVYNRTDMAFLDTVLSIGMGTLDLKGISIQVKLMSEDAKQSLGSDIQLKGFIYGWGNQYILWMDQVGRQESISIVAHELIHVLQYRSEQLVHKGDTVYWNKKSYTYKEMPYDTRPWEADAFEKQVPLERTIRSALY